jgi:UDP-glucuronate 4-epimerase
MTILVTGAAGSIGMHVCQRLLSRGEPVFGIDNLNDYYTPALKHARIAHLTQQSGFRFNAVDLADAAALTTVFQREAPDRVVHLAGQAGVRYALDHPQTYTSSNLVGTANILENCRLNAVKHLVFASSSSVYGGNQKVPFSEGDPVDHPISFYAATKRATEVMAHSYAHLFSLPISVLRYFTVYGPWGRPDMAIWKFTEAMLANRPIDVYGEGLLARDFTFVEDAADATVMALDRPSQRTSSVNPADWDASGPDRSWAPFEIYNVGRSDPVSVNDLLTMLEQLTGRKAQRNELPLQPGDVQRTFADCTKIRQALGWQPQVSLLEGLQRWVAWYRTYRA